MKLRFFLILASAFSFQFSAFSGSQVRPSAGGGGGTPGGSNTQFEYNSSGSFAGAANFTYDGTSPNSATPIIFTSGGSTSTAQAPFRFKNNEASKGDFGIGLSFTAGSNGATRRDNILSIGFNPSGPLSVANDDQFFMNFENTYTTAQSIRQGEFYFVAGNAAGTWGVRPFGIEPHYDLQTVTVDVNADSFTVGQYNFTPWANFGSVGNDGLLNITGNSTITYSGTATDFLLAAGASIIGKDSNGPRFSAGSSTASIFTGYSASGDDMTLNFGGLSGNKRGIRWKSSGSTVGFQFQNTDGSIWQGFDSIQQLLDVNQHKILTFTAASSAANYLDIANSQSGDPILTASGGGTDIGEIFQLKGAGRATIKSASSANAIFPLKIQGPSNVGGQGVGWWVQGGNNSADRDWGVSTSYSVHGDLTFLVSSAAQGTPGTKTLTLFSSGGLSLGSSPLDAGAGNIGLAAGSASAPSYAVGATNTGIYSASGSSIDVTIGGARKQGFLSDGSILLVGGNSAITANTGQDLYLQRNGSSGGYFTLGVSAFYPSSDNSIDLGTSGNRIRDVRAGRDIYSGNASFLIRSTTALTDGSGGSAGTLANAPAVGNPTKWISIDDNGTTRKIPAW